MLFKAELEKAWRLVDGAHDKENRARETIQQLKREIANLSDLIESGKLSTAEKLGDERDMNDTLEGARQNAQQLQVEVTNLRERLMAADENCTRHGYNISIAVRYQTQQVALYENNRVLFSTNVKYSAGDKHYIDPGS